MIPSWTPPREWEPPSPASHWGEFRVTNRGRVMKKVRRNRQHAKFARLRRHLEISSELTRPRRIRTRSARYAASLAEQLGLIERPKCCSWCRRRRRLERHHWDYNEPLVVAFLCGDCHDIADSMNSEAITA